MQILLYSKWLKLNNIFITFYQWKMEFYQLNKSDIFHLATQELTYLFQNYLFYIYIINKKHNIRILILTKPISWSFNKKNFYK